LVSDDHFDPDVLKAYPETIIFINTKNGPFENENYTLKFSSES
jgi:hypothetical protein